MSESLRTFLLVLPLLLSACADPYAKLPDVVPDDPLIGGVGPGNGVDDPTVFGCANEDDRHEPNDTFDQALPVSEGEDLVVYNGSPDFFRITVPPRTRSSVELKFPAALGNLDLQVMNVDGENVAAAATITDNEAVTFENWGENDEDFIVRVFVAGQSEKGCIEYDYNVVHFTIPPEDCNDGFGIDEDEDGAADCRDYECVERDPICQALCPEDSFENNDWFHQPSLIDASFGVSAMVHQQDDDWFQFTVPPQSVGIAGSAFTHADGDIDMWIYDQNYNLIAYSAYIPDVEETSWINDTDVPVTYNIMVEIWEGDSINPCNTFTFYTDSEPIRAECKEDDLEPNDNPTNALPTTGEVDVTITDLSEDWFSFDVAPLSYAKVRVEFLNAYGDLALEVWNPTGPTVMYRSPYYMTTQNYDEVRVYNPYSTTTTYLARVASADVIFNIQPATVPFCNTYDLVIEPE